MKPNGIKSVLAAAVCLASLHSQAQNVSKLAIELQSQKQQMWSVGKVNQANPEIKTQEIYKRTLDFLKSPNRVQKMGGMDGGGGNALLCNENGRVTTELLDVYEARSLGVQFELGGKNNMLEILDHVFNRLSKVSPLRATVYSAMARDLLTKDTQWVSNKQMPVIDDVNLATIPQECLLVQVAIQRPLDQSNLPNAKTYIIDSEMFNLLDETSKAALVLHEVLYREARYSGVSNSIFTRHLVGLIMSREIKEYNTKTLNQLYGENKVYCHESEDTPTFIKYDFEGFHHNRCDFIDKLNYNINFSNQVSFEVKNVFKLTEKWTGQSTYRISSFNSINGRFGKNRSSTLESEIKSSPEVTHKTAIELTNGNVVFQADFESGKFAKTLPILIKNGSIETNFYFSSTNSSNLPLDFEAIKISPYTSTNINHYLEHVNVKHNTSEVYFRVMHFWKKEIRAKEIKFSDSSLRLKSINCVQNIDNCFDHISLYFSSEKETIELSSEKENLQIFHSTASKLNVPSKYIEKDGWVNVSMVRFDSKGKVSEYTVSPNPKNYDSNPIWIKYQ